MRSKAPETAKPKAAPPVVAPAARPPVIPSNPLQPAASAPGRPHAVAPAPIPAAAQVEPETAVEAADVPPPVALFGRPEDEASEPHWIDPVTGFPDTQRRRDGSLFSEPRTA